MRRRTFIKAAGLGAAAFTTGAFPGGLRAAADSHFSAAALPSGNAPKPVPIPHFPSRLHAFVWRNWELVPLERMARVVGAKPGQITELARAMGLPRQRHISESRQRRSHITIIKRNWHLLPYEQLLALLDWTPEKLAYVLREDDFLYVKLGNHKPKCEALRWIGRDASMRAREKGISALVREYFDEEQSGAEPLFDFVDELSTPLWFPKLPKAGGGLRLCYSYFALYGDPLLETDLDPYPDGYLARLSECGVNAVWLQGVLSRLALFPWQPEASDRRDERLANLRRLVERAGKRGIRVFLYLNEPRSWPRPFFDTHPQLKGVTEGGHAALCTSVPEVRRWMRDAVAQICSAVPDLGGFFTITTSENLTNCWSHGAGTNCPRCREKSPAHVIADVNVTIQEGIERARARAVDKSGGPELIAWDWGWNEAWAPDIIRRLPQGCSLMSVSEWSLPIERGGVKTSVGEYSISSIGPGPRAKRHWALARERGLKTIAKIQANNSWELSAVPYTPALENVARHAANLRASGVEDVMLGWTLGGYPSPNLQAVQDLLRKESTLAPAEALKSIARARFGIHADAVLTAWHEFSAGFSEFPFHGGLVYSAPLQVGPANLLFEKPTGYAASMVGFPYDDLKAWRAVYPAPVFIAQLEKVADGFNSGLRALTASVSRGGDRKSNRALRDEIHIATAAEVHFRSVANQARFIVGRDTLAKATPATQAREVLAELDRLLRSEIDLARRLYRVQRADGRIGFEATNHYYYVPGDLMEKVLNCRDLLDRWLPAERSRRL